MGRSSVRTLVAVITVLTLIWVAMVGYAGARFLSIFHVSLTSCLPADFPKYPRATLASIVISDAFGDCTVQYQTRDSGEEVKAFFETNLDEGDWIVTGVSEQAGQIRFTRYSDPNLRGYVQVVGFPGQTQFQIQIRAQIQVRTG